ncbi:hypothetical protein APX01_09095 [Cereibacter sphaeroides]|nr:hypothetical protein APX01_09095 [Cereibacter sphaeroides]ANS34397.1 hypothetical protein A3858_09120 [Cereibacter sphaeroides]ATN63442.1 hypothetical protein A3857_09115 [Cereibacter sphaeroides]QJC85563.1 hypothetical protein HGN32_04395 [Cereibacter sphaeroides]
MHRTEKEVVSAEKWETLLAEAAADWPTSSKYLPELKQRLAEIIVQDGFPDPGAAIFHKGRFWCKRLEGERPVGKAISPGWAFTRAQAEPLTLPHEAADLYLKVIEVERALAAGNLESVFSHSLLLGLAHSRFNARRLHLKHVTRGKKVAGGQLNSAHKTNQRHIPMRTLRFARMAELVPKLGVENAARQCEAEGMGGWQGIKKQWDRFK